MSDSTTAAIEALLAVHNPVDVPGYARKYHDIIVSHERVREINLARLKAQGREAVGGNAPLKVPDDFHIHGAAEFSEALMDRYGVAINVITRWRRETGIRPPEHRKSKPMPRGFAATAQGMTNQQLSVAYSVGRETLWRWLDECGLPRERHVKVTSKGRPNAYLSTPVDRAHRDGSVAGEAAEFLRRLGPVYRCAPTGRADPKGTHWRRGSALLSDEELVGRAKRNGWRPDAWREIAA